MSHQTNIVGKYRCPNCGNAYTADFCFPLHCRCGAKCFEDGTFREPRVWTEDERRLFEELKAEAERCCNEEHTPAPIGPGTELTKRLYWLALITGKTKCRRCKRIARIMDRMGCDWCEANIDTLVKWLRKSHTKLPRVARSFIPFVEPLVRAKVTAAIEAARD